MAKPKTTVKKSVPVSTSTKKKITKSVRSGLTMSVSRVQNQLKRGRYVKHIRTGAAIYLSAVLEYLAAEVMELSGNAARDNKKRRIIPRHITLAVKSDPELDVLLQDVTISNGGVLPFIHQVLLPKQTKERKSPSQEV